MENATLVVAATLVGATAAISLLQVVIDRQENTTTMQQLFKYFNEKANQAGLQCGFRQIFSDYIVGLDPAAAMVLVALKEDDQRRSFMISLREVKTCTVEKQFNRGKGSTDASFLAGIVLRFRFISDQPPVDLPFYHHAQHHIFMASEMENKAKAWAGRITAVLGPEKTTGSY